MTPETHELQKICITIPGDAMAALTQSLRDAGIDSARLIPGKSQRGNVSIELCLTGPQVAKIIDAVLPAVTHRARGCSDEVVIASLGPNTGPQPCCKQAAAASDRGETPYAAE